MIKYFPEFEIDINTFYHLPKPTTLRLSSKSLKTSNGDIINIILRPDPKASIKKIKNSVDLEENDFKFSHKTVKILKKKMIKNMSVRVGIL